jgi:hypothetical protein
VREPERDRRRSIRMKRFAIAGAVTVAAILIIGAAALASPRGPGGAAPGRHTVAAPIDRLDVLIRESAPPQVSLKVAAGLPDGCAEQHSHSVTRAGDTFTVSVLNSMPDGNPICDLRYGIYELNIRLDGEFRPGATYTVQVNDKTTTFKT